MTAEGTAQSVKGMFTALAPIIVACYTAFVEMVRQRVSYNLKKMCLIFDEMGTRYVYSYRESYVKIYLLTESKQA